MINMIPYGLTMNIAYLFNEDEKNTEALTLFKQLKMSLLLWHGRADLKEHVVRRFVVKL